MPEILRIPYSLGNLYDLKFPITKNFERIYGSRVRVRKFCEK